MARFASQMKMGFYPTPISVVTAIGKYLKFPDSLQENSLRVLDPCCGEGVSLGIITEGTSAATYGIELNKERYVKASEKLDYVFQCDALSEVRTTAAAYSLLWLNPPYDDSSDENGDRLESDFLKTYNKFLMNDGILIFIIPALSLRYTAALLSSQYKDIRVLSFPKKEYASFKQIVVIARKCRASKKIIEENTQYLSDHGNIIQGYLDDLYDILPDTNSDLNYEVKPSKIPDDRFRFFSIRLDPDEMRKLIDKDGLFEHFIDMATHQKQRMDIQPLTTLRKGHIAMLLAGGFMNGEIEKSGRRYCIKGNVFKQNNLIDEETDKDGKSKSIYRTHYNIVINMYDYQKNEFQEVKA